MNTIIAMVIGLFIGGMVGFLVAAVFSAERRFGDD